MIEVFRLAGAEFKDSLWSGEGGLHVDGRWHIPGKRIVYTAQSLSLAQLEVLVHIADRRQIPTLAQAVAVIPDTVPIATVDHSALPSDWRRFAPYSAITQHLGMAWLSEMSTAVLKVPSAVSETEWNFLLNPAHTDFRSLNFGVSKDFSMDSRLL
ncbi:MAG TPA: RES family NAD+ phosphorylase [Steroidobacteraceae bacterium]